MALRAKILSLVVGAAGMAAIVFVATRANGQSSVSRREPEPPARHPARGTRAAIAAGTDHATDAGMRIFHAGGNAVDAGVAALFAAAVTEYSHFGFGGEAPILIRTKTGKVVSIAGVGTMPKLATAQYFRERKPKPGEVQWLEPNGLKGFVPAAGIMPALVPGMVDAGLLALREYGTKSFAEIIQPAIERAEATPLDELRAGTIRQGRRFFELWPDSKAVFIEGAPNGVRTGAILKQLNLARTMRAMAAAELTATGTREARIDAVRDFFYRGEVARKIDQFMKDHDGLMRYEDLAAFKLQVEDAVSTTYRGFTVHKPGFWSQGPSMIQALNLLEAAGTFGTLQLNSAEFIHQLTEALKLVYADRDSYYGDPAFVKMPTERLLSREYAAERWSQVNSRASLDFRPGAIDGKTPRHPSQEEIVRTPIDDALMARDTTSIDAIDKDGIMFSATPSGAWLPSVIAGDTGIPLTQRAQSFLLIPGHPNELAGGKRPRVTLSPTLVTREGRPYLALSTPGGDNQEQSLLQVMLNIIHFGMNVQAAVEAPRVQTRHLVSSFDNHSMNPGDLILDDRISAAVVADLRERGHRVQMRSRWNSGAAPVAVRVTNDGVIEAGSDPYAYRSARAW